MKRYCEECDREPRDQAEHVLMEQYGLCNECYDKVKDKSKLVKREWCQEHDRWDTCQSHEGMEAEEA